jgi:Cu/Ag efflux pump CusA
VQIELNGSQTVAVILAGLLPILLGGGTGSEVMSRIAAPMMPRSGLQCTYLMWYI